MASAGSRAASAAFLLHAAGKVGDYWIQRGLHAKIKGAYDDEPVILKDEAGVETVYKTAEGRRACAHHVITYTATQAFALAVGNRVLGLGISPARMAAGLAISGATHFIADRRRPIKRLAEMVGPEKAEFYAMQAPICGSLELDQATHRGCEAIAALVMGRGRKGHGA